MFANVALIERSVASKGEPRFIAKALRQVSVSSPRPFKFIRHPPSFPWGGPTRSAPMPFFTRQSRLRSDGADLVPRRAGRATPPSARPPSRREDLASVGVQRRGGGASKRKDRRRENATPGGGGGWEGVTPGSMNIAVVVSKECCFARARVEAERGDRCVVRGRSSVSSRHSGG